MDARTSVELFERLAEVISKLSPERQGAAIGRLGLSNSADRILREGPGYIQEGLREAESLGVRTNEMTRKAELEFRSDNDLNRALEFLFDSFTSEASPGKAKAKAEWTNFLSGFSEYIGFAGKLYGDSYSETKPLATGGLTSAGLHASGRALTAVGSVVGGSVLTAAGTVVLAGTTSALAIDSIDKADQQLKSFGMDWLDVLALPYLKTINEVRDFVGYSGAPVYEGNATRTIRVDRIDIKVEGAGNPEEVGRAVIKSLTREVQKAEQDIITGSKG
jgi:hypothetical protein